MLGENCFQIFTPRDRQIPYSEVEALPLSEEQYQLMLGPKFFREGTGVGVEELRGANPNSNRSRIDWTGMTSIGRCLYTLRLQHNISLDSLVKRDFLNDSDALQLQYLSTLIEETRDVSRSQYQGDLSYLQYLLFDRFPSALTDCLMHRWGSDISTHQTLTERIEKPIHSALDYSLSEAAKLKFPTKPLGFWHWRQGKGEEFCLHPGITEADLNERSGEFPRFLSAYMEVDSPPKIYGVTLWRLRGAKPSI